MMWDRNNPLHKEIMEANKAAWLRRQEAQLAHDLRVAIAKLPWWLRMAARVFGWVQAIKRGVTNVR